MRRIVSLVAALLRDWIRNREAVFFSLLFPIILLVIFTSVFAGGSAEFTLYVQNNDVGPDGEPTNSSARLVGAMNDTDALSIQPLDPERNLTAWSESGEDRGTKRVVVISEGFAQRVRERSGAVRQAVVADTVDRFGDRMNESTRSRIDRGLGQLDGNATTASSPATITLLAAPDDNAAPAVRGLLTSVVASFNDRALGIDAPVSAVGTGELESRDLDAVDYYLPAFIAVVVMINGVISVTSVVAGFTADGTLKRLVATPLRKRDWILANVLQQSLLALVLTGVMVLVAALLYGISAVPGPLAIALVLLGAIGFSALGMALGSALSDPDAATSLGNAIAFPLMFVSGVFWEIDLMPASLQLVAELSPLYYFHLGLRRLLILETTDGVLLPFAVLAGLAVASLALAIRVTTWQDF